jgi:hypothetical protein
MFAKSRYLVATHRGGPGLEGGGLEHCLCTVLHEFKRRRRFDDGWKGLRLLSLVHQVNAAWGDVVQLGCLLVTVFARQCHARRPQDINGLSIVSDASCPDGAVAWCHRCAMEKKTLCDGALWEGGWF